MSIRHKFYQNNFENGFQTINAILATTPYKPEVMIVGTFNPETPNTNFADFYYGRNFFWPSIYNLFINDGIFLTKRRMPTRGNPLPSIKPSLPQIFQLCSKLKLTFSDLVLEIFNNNNSNYQFLQNGNIIFKDIEYNLIQDGRKWKVEGLQQLSLVDEVNWNTQNIINYLIENPQIKTIYFTRKPIGVWAEQWNLIVNHSCIKDRRTTNIFTPSGAGKPVYRNVLRLLNHWIFSDNPNFGKLDKNWLREKGININKFK
jgi:hypothetical protein